jgi:hypothetical protein
MNFKAILVAGLVASVVMAMVQMVGEAIVPAGAGFFGPPIAIGATVVRGLQGSANPIPFDLLGLVAGLAGHMMNSVILAAVFAALASAVGRSLGTVGLVVAGMAWGVAVFAVMWYVVVPIVDPLAGSLNAAWFVAAHLMWGASLGYLWSRLSERAPVSSLVGARGAAR